MNIVRILLECKIIPCTVIGSVCMWNKGSILCVLRRTIASHFPLTLQVICNIIFQSNGIANPGLLFNPPKRIADHLDELLETCGHPQHLIRYFNDTLVRSPPNVLNSLRSLLRESIKET